MTKIKSIRKMPGKVPQKCLKLSTSDGLYVTDGHIVTHNCIISAAISEMTMFTDNGWALDLNTPVLMEDGTQKLLKDVKVGDRLLHPKNEENIVLSIPYEKLSDQYRIVLDDGKDALCHKDHIWKVSFRKDKSGNEVYELSTTEFMILHPELEFSIPEIEESGLKLSNSKVLRIEKMPDQAIQKCITVSSKDGLFVLGNGIVTHNSPEKVLTFFTKLRKRIQSRIGSNYYARFLIDSQPNDLESPIDKWIWEDAPKNKDNYIFTGSRWKLFPQEFKDAWEKPKNYWTEPVSIKQDFGTSFPLYKGGNGQIPLVIESPNQLEQYDAHDIIWCPIMQITDNGPVNFKDMALENPVEFLRDWAGIPSGAADRIFYDSRVVEDVFDNGLKNCFGGLDCPASEEPEHLIWNKIRDKFFNKIFDKWYFYYEPDIPRVASVDLAISGDVAAVSVSHVEKSMTKKDIDGNPAKVYVTDFSIPIVPKNSIINMDAFKFFLLDLVRIGNMHIHHVSFDGFQSRAMMQSLERNGFQVDLLSVDKDNTPYQNMIDYTFHRRWVCGKSIMMKNNLLSLEVQSRKSGSKKIDHKRGENTYTDEFCPINGQYNDKAWTVSQVGYYAKDLTDTVAANINLLDKYDNEFIPIHTWDPDAVKERTQESVTKDRDSLMKKMGLSF